jgi:hypothetical protein
VVESAGFDGADHIAKSGVEAVEGFIQQRALAGFCWCGVPEFHAPIIFEDVFDDKFFPNEIRKVGDQKLAPNRSTHPRQDPPSAFPLLLPALL